MNYRAAIEASGLTDNEIFDAIMNSLAYSAKARQKDLAGRWVASPETRDLWVAIKDGADIAIRMIDALKEADDAD